jgi:hypothetical protein
MLESLFPLGTGDQHGLARPHPRLRGALQRYLRSRNAKKRRESDDHAPPLAPSEPARGGSDSAWARLRRLGNRGAKRDKPPQIDDAGGDGEGVGTSGADDSAVLRGSFLVGGGGGGGGVGIGALAHPTQARPTGDTGAKTGSGDAGDGDGDSEGGDDDDGDAVPATSANDSTVHSHAPHLLDGLFQCRYGTASSWVPRLVVLSQSTLKVIDLTEQHPRVCFSVTISPRLQVLWHEVIHHL